MNDFFDAQGESQAVIEAEQEQAAKDWAAQIDAQEDAREAHKANLEASDHMGQHHRDCTEADCICGSALWF